MTTAAEKLKAASDKAAAAAVKKVEVAAAKKAKVAAKKLEMATKKKADAAAAKLAKAVAKAEAKANIVVYTADQVELSAGQVKTLEMISRNQDRILSNAGQMVKLATDSGKRLMALQEAITLKYGRVWKEWCQTAGNLSIGYEMATRYVKLAANESILIENDIQATSIVDAVQQIEHIKKPEKKAAAEAAAAEKAKQPKGGKPKLATAGIISNATIEEVQQCNDIEDLRNVIDLCNSRIEDLQQAEQDAGEEDDDADDQADIDEQVDTVDPLS